MKVIFLLVGSAILISSCSVTTSMKTSQRKLNRQAEVNATGSKVINKPIVAEVVVSKERKTTIYKTTNKDMANSLILVSGSGNKKRKKGSLLFSASENMKNEAQNRAQFQFMSEHQCDYLVDPLYKVDVESTSESKIINITVEVSAYPANYIKFTQPDSLPKSIVGEDPLANTGSVSRSLFGSKFELPSLNKEKKISSDKVSKPRIENPSSFGFMAAFGQNTFITDPLSVSDFNSSVGEFGSSEIDPGYSVVLGLSYFKKLSNRFGLHTGLNLNANIWKTVDSFYIYDFNYQISGERTTNGTIVSIETPIGVSIRLFKSIYLQTGIVFSYHAFSRYSYKDEGIKYDFFGASEFTNEESGAFKLNSPSQTGAFTSLEYQSKSGFFVGVRRQSSSGDLEWNANYFYLGKRF